MQKTTPKKVLVVEDNFMNKILISNGYFPIIVYKDNKLSYFNALEKLGYVIYALNACQCGYPEWAYVLKQHHSELLKYCKKFCSCWLRRV